MSMKVTLGRNGGYEIKLEKIKGRTHANNIDELKLAIEHYFGTGESASHFKTNEGLKDCPLCRAYRNSP